MIWIFFGICTYKKIAWKKIKKEHPVFWLFLKILNIDLGPLKSKFFKSEKSTKSAIKKSTYSKNFKSFAQKLWFWRTNCYLFLGHPVVIIILCYVVLFLIWKCKYIIWVSYHRVYSLLKIRLVKFQENGIQIWNWISEKKFKIQFFSKKVTCITVFTVYLKYARLNFRNMEFEYETGFRKMSLSVSQKIEKWR